MENIKEHYPSKPDYKFHDLSRQDLLHLIGMYRNLIRALDGFWYLSVMQEEDNDLALKCDIDTWNRMIKYELDKITKLFEIKGNDLFALFKALRFEPMFGETDYQVEYLSDNEAIMTVTECPVLRALEKENQGRESQICRIVEPIVMKCYASYFNPAIVSEALEVPPREIRGDVCCRWRFAIGTSC